MEKVKRKKGRPKTDRPTKTVYKSLWLTPQLMARIKGDVRLQQSTSFGAFVTDALEAYLAADYPRAENNT